MVSCWHDCSGPSSTGDRRTLWSAEAGPNTTCYPFRALRLNVAISLHLVSAKPKSGASCHADCDRLLVQEVAFLTSVLTDQQEQHSYALRFLQSEWHLAGAETLPETLSVHHLLRIPNVIIIGKRHLQWECSTRYLQASPVGPSRDHLQLVQYLWPNTQAKKTLEFCPRTPIIWVWLFHHKFKSQTDGSRKDCFRILCNTKFYGVVFL